MRLRTFLRAKIHRARITAADVEYVGSVTIDADLLAAAGIAEYEFVQVVDVTNGARLETYVMLGEPGSGVIQMNGAAARLVQVGDVVIIMAYELSDEPEGRESPRIVIVDPSTNTIAQPVG